jgi:hypothetical protein
MHNLSVEGIISYHHLVVTSTLSISLETDAFDTITDEFFSLTCHFPSALF